MKQAGPSALDRLEPLLLLVRSFPGFKEKRRGVFYWRSRACLHFHEDGGDLWADLRPPGESDFTRLSADGTTAQAAILARLKAISAA